MNISHKSAAAAIAVVSALALAGCSEPGGAGQEGDGPIVIGIDTALSGTIGALGQQNLNAIQLYFDKVNEDGGVLGRQIELISRATPKRHYYLQSARGNRLFELGLGPIALALCGASDPASQRRLDTILAEHGAEAFADRFLRDGGLGWAADLLGHFPAP